MFITLVLLKLVLDQGQAAKGEGIITKLKLKLNIL